MDNLELLKQLPSDSIDLVYSDILYNTGKKFKDYDDNLGTTQQAIEWYRPRLKELKRVLKGTGNIAIHLDNNLSHYMKVAMDEIFNGDCFVEEIVWKRSHGNSLSKGITNIVDKILIYRMGDESTYHQQYHQDSKDRKWKFEKETGRYFTHAMLENKANFKYKGEERIIGGEVYSTDIGWKWSQDTINGRFRKNPHLFYIARNGKVRYKQYKDEVQGTHITNLWVDVERIGSNGSESVGYFSQKPRKLLERIINMLSNKGDIVADFFMGSGTTIDVAKEFEL